MSHHPLLISQLADAHIADRHRCADRRREAPHRRRTPPVRDADGLLARGRSCAPISARSSSTAPPVLGLPLGQVLATHRLAPGPVARPEHAPSGSTSPTHRRVHGAEVTDAPGLGHRPVPLGHCSLSRSDPTRPEGRVPVAVRPDSRPRHRFVAGGATAVAVLDAAAAGAASHEGTVRFRRLRRLSECTVIGARRSRAGASGPTAGGVRT
jgi:hypothetical protein